MGLDKKIVLFLACVLIIPSAYASEQVPMIEAYALEDPVCTTPYITNCFSDDNFTTQLTKYSVLTDGDSTTGATISTTTTNVNQFSSLRSSWLIEDVRNGKYYLRLFIRPLSGSTIPDGTELHLYKYTSHLEINTMPLSFQVNGTPRWFEFDVTDLVEQAHDMNGQLMVAFRYGSNEDIVITEERLIQPVLIVDSFSILANGVVITAANNNTVEHAWNVLFNQPLQVSNSSCIVYDVEDNSVMNTTNFAYEFQNETQRFIARWTPSEETGFKELHSYKIQCAGRVHLFGESEVFFDAKGFTQYVYITGEMTVLERLQSILDTVLEIFGIVERNDIAEAAAFDTLTVDISDASGFVGEQKLVSTAVTTSRVPIDSVNCSLDVFGPQSRWLTGTNMTFREWGIYEANITLPEEVGTHRAVTSCTDGILNQTEVRGTTSWQVRDGARMVSIT